MIRWVVALVVVATLGAACTTGEGDPTTTTVAASGSVTTTTIADVTTSRAEGATTSTVTDEGVRVDVGVDPATKTITLGVLADLTGLFAPLVIDITDAQRAFWDDVNANGGLRGGWEVELVIVDAL